jgi:antitoxin (DNA-binding transcriptional repressor) of toxin-antitoxin stability system
MAQPAFHATDRDSGPILTLSLENELLKEQLFTMRKVTIQELKKHLSAILAEVAAGAHVLITRHQRPVAQPGPTEQEHVHVGSQFGRGRIRPLFQAKTRGKYLEVLVEDRGRRLTDPEGAAAGE